MMRYRSGSGFTVVEVMIVLAVSSFLLVGGMLIFRGQAARVEFTQTVREFESQLADIVNDVSTGYYQSNGNITCSESAGGTVDISGNPQELGTNGDCIFLGKIILFAPQDVSTLKESGYRVYTLAGLRLNDLDKPVQNILEAKPVLIAQSNAAPSLNSFPDVFSDTNLGGSIKIKSVTYKNDSGASEPSFGIGLITTFGTQMDGFLLSGSTNSQLVGMRPYIDGLTSPDHTRTSTEFVDEINKKLSVGPTITLENYDKSVINNHQVEVCVESAGISPVRYGHITIGGGSRQLKTNSIINGVPCP